jgi:hypothetical protein
MKPNNVLPPGQHAYDPSKKEVDAIGFALQRLQAHLTSVEEHRASFEKYRKTDDVAAQQELFGLTHSTKEALRHFLRLAELLLAGYTLDPSKRLPKGLCDPQWLDRIHTFLDQEKGTR